jgi:hypothetical protein
MDRITDMILLFYFFFLIIMTNTTHEEYLVAYFANAMTAEDCLASIGTEQSDANSEILATAQREWDEVECDPE